MRKYHVLFGGTLLWTKPLINQKYVAKVLNKVFQFKQTGDPTNCTLSMLTPDQSLKLIKFIENLNLLINNNLKKSKIMLAKKLVQIKAYKGIRKLRGLPVRGQRTHTNAKTASKFR